MRQQTKTQPGIMQVGMMQASMSQPGIRQPEIMQPGGLQAGIKTQAGMEQSERDDGAAATVTAKALLAGEVSGKCHDCTAPWRSAGRAAVSLENRAPRRPIRRLPLLCPRHSST